MQAPGLLGSGKYWSIHNSQWSPIVFLVHPEQIPFVEPHIKEFPLHSQAISKSNQFIVHPWRGKKEKKKKKENLDKVVNYHFSNIHLYIFHNYFQMYSLHNLNNVQLNHNFEKILNNYNLQFFFIDFVLSFFTWLKKKKRKYTNTNSIFIRISKFITSIHTFSNFKVFFYFF